MRTDVSQILRRKLSVLLTSWEQRYKMTDPGVFLHDSLDGSNECFTNAQTVMTFIYLDPFFDIQWLCFLCNFQFPLLS